MVDTVIGVGDLAPDITLPDQDGHEVKLSDLWIKQPLVLVFIRHYG